MSGLECDPNSALAREAEARRMDEAYARTRVESEFAAPASVRRESEATDRDARRLRRDAERAEEVRRRSESKELRRERIRRDAEARRERTAAKRAERMKIARERKAERETLERRRRVCLLYTSDAADE